MGVEISKTVMTLAEQEGGPNLEGSFIATYKLGTDYKFAHHLLAYGEEMEVMERLPPPHPPLRPRKDIALHRMKSIDFFARKMLAHHVWVPYYRMGKYVQENIENDNFFKARFVYHWVTHMQLSNYHLKANKPPDWRTVMYQLWRIQTGRGSWAQLTALIARCINLPCVLIHGKVKDGEYHLGKWSNISDHYGEWNAVLLGRDWWLMDTHWGGRALYGDPPPDGFTLVETGDESRVHEKPEIELTNEPPREQSHYSEAFFLTTPYQMVATHLPAMPEWQLMHRKMSELRFETMVHLGTRFFDLQMGILTNPLLFVFARDDVEILFNLPAAKLGTCRFCYRMYRSDIFGKGKNQDSMVVITKMTPDMLEILVQSSYNSLFRLELYGKDTGDPLMVEYERVASYLVKFDQKLSKKQQAQFAYGYLGPIRTMYESPELFEATLDELMQLRTALKNHENNRYKIALAAGRLIWKNPQDMSLEDQDRMDQVLRLGYAFEDTEQEPGVVTDDMGRVERLQQMFQEQANLETGALYGALGMRDLFGEELEFLASKTFAFDNLDEVAEVLIGAGEDTQRDPESRRKMSVMGKRMSVMGGRLSIMEMPIGLGAAMAAAAEEEPEEPERDLDAELRMAENKRVKELAHVLERHVREANTDALEQILMELEKMTTPKALKYIAICKRNIEIFDLMDAIEDAMDEKNFKNLSAVLSLAQEKGYLRSFPHEFVVKATQFRDRLAKIEELKKTATSIDNKNMSELKAYTHPPEVVLKVLGACSLLMGSAQKDVQDWNHVRQVLCKTGKENFKRKIAEFRINEVPYEAAKHASKMLGDIDEMTVENTSIGAFAFFMWARGTVNEVLEFAGEAKHGKGRRRKNKK